MKRRARIAAVSAIALALTLASATHAIAQLTLYAAAKGEVGDFAPSTLYTLGIADAVAVEIGPIQGPDPNEPGTIHWENVTGLAFLPDGRLVGAASADALLAPGRGSALIEIDRQTGAANFIGIIDDDTSGVCGRITDLAYESLSGVLYGIGKGCLEDQDQLYSIDTQTGEGAAIGVIDAATRKGNGVSAQPVTGQLFATRTRFQMTGDGPDRLVLELQTLDPESGNGTLIQQSNTGTIGGIDFHPIDGVLYGVGLDEEEIDSDTVELVPAFGTIDTANARFTRIGVTTLDGADLFGVEAIAFRPPGGCPVVARVVCFGPRKSRFSYKASSGKLKWKWSRGGFDLDALGDPTVDTDYRVCVYQTNNTPPLIIAGADAPAGDGWKTSKKGYRYKSKSGEPNGITSLHLKSGADKAKVSLKGKNFTLPLPLLQIPSALVEVSNAAGSCWQAIYGSPAKKNDEKGFEDKFK
jgi:hypothetical protein